MHWVNLVVDEISFGHRVIVVHGVAPSRLRVSVGHIILEIERVHEIELRGLLLVEDLLVQGVEIFSVINDHFSVASTD